MCGAPLHRRMRCECVYVLVRGLRVRGGTVLAMGSTLDITVSLGELRDTNVSLGKLRDTYVSARLLVLSEESIQWRPCRPGHPSVSSRAAQQQAPAQLHRRKIRAVLR